MDKNRLTDIENVIDRYCDSYLNSAFDEGVEYVEHRSKVELAEAQKRDDARPWYQRVADGQMVSVGGMNYKMNPTGSAATTTGNLGYTLMSYDTIVDMASERLNSNSKYQNDISRLGLEICYAFNPNYDLLSEKEQDDVWKKASEYLGGRIRQNWVRHLGEYDIPKSKISYIIQKAYKNTLFNYLVEVQGGGNNALRYGKLGEDKDNYVNTEARRRLGINKLDDFASEGISFGIDGVLFGGLGVKGRGAWAATKNVGKGFAGYWAWGKGMDLISGPNVTSQIKDSQKYFGSYYVLDDIMKQGLSQSGHDNTYLNYLNTVLENKVDFRPDGKAFQSKALSWKKHLLSSSKGSNQALRRSIRDELSRSSDRLTLWRNPRFDDINPSKIKELSSSTQYDVWMEKLSWQQCRNQAAYWAGVFHYMMERREAERNFNGKVLTLEDVAGRAISYANAADHNLQEQQKEAALQSKTKHHQREFTSKGNLRPDQTRDLVRQGLYKVGLYAGVMDNNVPSWMNNMKHADCQRWAAYYISRAQAVMESGGDKERYQALAQKAWHYAQAGCRNIKTEQNIATNVAKINTDKQYFLSQSHGSNQKLRQLIRAEITKDFGTGYNDFAKSTSYDTWMMKMSWSNLHNQAAYWAGALRKMSRDGNATMNFNGKTLTKKQVAEKALSYANGAVQRLYLDNKDAEKKAAQAKKNVAFNSKAESYKAGIFAKAKGSNYQLKNLIAKDFNQMGKKTFASAVPKWMKNINSAQCHKMAAFYYGIAKALKEGNIPFANINGKRVTFDQAAQTAWSYSKAAIQNLEREKANQQRQQQQTNRAKNTTAANQFENTKARLLLFNRKKGLKFDNYQPGGQKMPPKWMMGMSEKQCRDQAAFNLRQVEWCISHKTWGVTVNGKHVSKDELAQKAYDYAYAAYLIENGKGKTVAPSRSTRHAAAQSTAGRNNADQHTQARHQSSASHQTIHTSSRTPVVEDKTNNNGQSVSNSSSRSNPVVYTSETRPAQGSYSGTSQGGFTYAPQGAGAQTTQGYKFSTPGNNEWYKYLSSLGMNGFSDVTHNMGYVIGMLPDLLLNIFMGKAGFSLEKNLVPLIMIMGGLFTKKNPMLKLFLMGLGGAALLNNAGHRILGQEPTKLNEAQPVKRYKVYQDEALNSRIQNPVIKGNQMMADIDGVPCIIGISNLSIDAYEKKAVPLNTLANAVLRKYDEQREQVGNDLNQRLNQNQQDSQDLNNGIK